MHLRRRWIQPFLLLSDRFGSWQKLCNKWVPWLRCWRKLHVVTDRRAAMEPIHGLTLPILVRADLYRILPMIDRLAKTVCGPQAWGQYFMGAAILCATTVVALSIRAAIKRMRSQVDVHARADIAITGSGTANLLTKHHLI